MIAAGSLNKRITLLAPSTVQDAWGGPGEPTEFATVWASIAPMSGSESFRAQQFVSEATVQIVIRYRQGVRSNMVARYDGPDGTRTFEVLVALNEREQNVQLTLLCKEINDR